MKKHIIKILCLVCILVSVHHNVSAAELPATPTGLTATPGYCNTGKIALSWTSISTASGAVEYTILDNGAVVYSGPSNTYTHAYLLPGSSHSYTVSARNPNGGSARSAPVASIVSSACTGAEPYISDVAKCFAFNAPYYAQIGEKFTASMTMQNIGNRNWTIASQYGLRSEYTPNNMNWGTNFISVPDTIPMGGAFTVSPIFTAPSTVGEYYFGWRMSRGASEWFPDISSVCGPYGTHKITVYDKPVTSGVSIKATPGACGTGKIDLSWNEPLGKPTLYEIRDGLTTVYTGSARSFRHLSLTPGSSHAYSLRAMNQYGYSSWSGSTKVTAPNTCSGASTPTPITNPNPMPVPAGADLSSNIAYIPPSTQNSTLTINATVKNIGTSSTVNGFTDSFSYQWNSATDNAWQPIVGGVIAKSALSAGAESTDTVRFAPTQIGTLYIRHCVDSNNSINEGTGENVGNCSISFTNVTNPLASTQPIPSGLVSPNGIPSVPTNISVKNIPSCDESIGGMIVSWSASNGATEYTLRDGNAVISTGGITSFSHTGLKAGSGHSYSVSAKNALGSSVFSSPVIGIVSTGCASPTTYTQITPNTYTNVTPTTYTQIAPNTYTNVTPTSYNSPNTGATKNMTTEQRDQMIAVLKQLIQLLQMQLSLLK